MPNFITFTNLRLVASTQFNTWSCWVAALIEGEGDTRLLFSVMSGRNPRGDLAVDAISLILNLSQRRKLVITHRNFFKETKYETSTHFAGIILVKILKCELKEGTITSSCIASSSMRLLIFGCYLSWLFPDLLADVVTRSQDYVAAYSFTGSFLLVVPLFEIASTVTCVLCRGTCLVLYKLLKTFLFGWENLWIVILQGAIYKFYRLIDRTNMFSFGHIVGYITFEFGTLDIIKIVLKPHFNYQLRVFSASSVFHSCVTESNRLFFNWIFYNNALVEISSRITSRSFTCN